MLFLLKPHIVGPDDAITSPDIVVDALWVDGERRPLALLTMEAWQQGSAEGARAAYAVMALGGGAILLPAVVLGPGPVVVSRMAWRLRSLDGHAGEVTLNAVPLSRIGLPGAEIEAAGGTGDALPRGVMVLRRAEPATAEAVLADPVRQRTLAHRVVMQDLAADLWEGERPRPRYSVGPTGKTVTHYI